MDVEEPHRSAECGDELKAAVCRVTDTLKNENGHELFEAWLGNPTGFNVT